jgi:hypothetical protein
VETIGWRCGVAPNEGRRARFAVRSSCHPSGWSVAHRTSNRRCPFAAPFVRSDSQPPESWNISTATRYLAAIGTDGTTCPIQCQRTLLPNKWGGLRFFNGVTRSRHQLRQGIGPESLIYIALAIRSSPQRRLVACVTRQELSKLSLRSPASVIKIMC